MPKKIEYLIIGDDNHWYASCLTSLKTARAEATKIIKHPELYSDNQLCEIADTLYIYKAEQVDEVDTG